jgi:hypothetical protein
MFFFVSWFGYNQNMIAGLLPITQICVTFFWKLPFYLQIVAEYTWLVLGIYGFKLDIGSVLTMSTFIKKFNRQLKQLIIFHNLSSDNCQTFLNTTFSVVPMYVFATQYCFHSDYTSEMWNRSIFRKSLHELLFTWWHDILWKSIICHNYKMSQISVANAWFNFVSDPKNLRRA